MDEGVVPHLQGGKGFICKVVNPITELVMTSREEAALLSIQCVKYLECSIASVAVGSEFWGIYYVS